MVNGGRLRRRNRSEPIMKKTIDRQGGAKEMEVEVYKRAGSKERQNARAWLGGGHKDRGSLETIEKKFKGDGSGGPQVRR